MSSANPSEGPTPLEIQGANILIYNKSRDVDRVCPACLRWYRVGEGFRSYSSLEEFRARPELTQPEVEQDVVTEQDVESPVSNIEAWIIRLTGDTSCLAYARGSA
jgi:hypothetical protein